MLLVLHESMATSDNARFMAGVIEGFYGPPWSPSERLELLGWMGRWGLNTYFYAPKDDLKHRTIWRELYDGTEAAVLRDLIRACDERGIRFVYGLGPGLDISYRSEADLAALKARFQQMLELGCDDFALLFDDLPDRMDAADVARWGSLAAAQCHVVNTLFAWTRQQRPHTRFLFCPTPYCDRMETAGLGGQGYLATVGRELAEPVEVFWTGPEIISREITVEQAQRLQGLLRRRPLLWDNLHANDYDGRRFYCGPYAGRAPGLRAELSGILTNPNTEFSLNYIPIRTLSEFIRCEGTWEPRAAYLSAFQEWQASFATVGRPLELSDLVLLGDCYYLPFAEGPEAEALYERIRGLLGSDPAGWGEQAGEVRRQVVRLREVCARLAELRGRPLFHALSRRLWELREEMDLLERFLQFHSEKRLPSDLFHSDFHLPGTYRGGMAARLQSLLAVQPDGSLRPSDGAAAIPDSSIPHCPNPARFASVPRA